MENWLKSLFMVSSNIDLNIIKKAIIDYRIEGKNLMFELGRKYGLDISNPADYEKLISRTNENIPRKGKLSENWNYVFHGGECGFDKNNQESVEVVLSNPPEFGHTNSWLLLSYMQSKENYRNEVKEMDW